MDLKSLIDREIGEGLAEEKLASVVGVSVRTIADSLVDELPQDQAIWEQFARHFRIHADLLRFDGPPHAEGLFDLISENNEEQHNTLCIVRAHEGKDLAYGEMRCAGKKNECKGDMTWVWGKGGFKGITGTTPFVAGIYIEQGKAGRIHGSAH